MKATGYVPALLLTLFKKTECSVEQALTVSHL
jgi:hypothetical protein